MNKETKILIVDDSPIVLEVVSVMLRGAGFAVVTIDSAFKLSRTIAEEEPDLILLDVDMPALRGDQAASILGRHRFAQNIPVVLHSDHEESRLAALVESTGASGFIRKTADSAKLVSQVMQWVDPACAYQAG